MNKRFALWGGLIAAMAVIIFVMIRFADNEPEATESRNPGVNIAPQNPEILEIRDDDWIKGNPDADVIIVKYSDFQCPACRFYASLDDQLSDDLGDDVVFVYRHFPLRNFEHSRLASQYAEAAGRQGQFWRMHDLLFINQQRWSRGDAESIFRQFAESMDLDMDQLEQDLNDPDIMERIDSDYEDGREVGVNAVPSIYINGERIEIPGSLDAYRELIESYL